ncbi:hypothetical protein CRUP_025784 [Coryphaenoides rupestris]|nr:hypothetical protein CRUP_025784 [Coryphaenoides rupestris]
MSPGQLGGGAKLKQRQSHPMRMRDWSRYPPPLVLMSQWEKPIKKQKMPRAATIKVSRKKKEVRDENHEVRVSSWLDMWKGFRHSVVWASMDGQLMSLWKKRTDYQVGVAWFLVPLNVASVKPAEKRCFRLLTPYRTFSVSWCFQCSCELQVFWCSKGVVMHESVLWCFDICSCGASRCSVFL